MSEEYDEYLKSPEWLRRRERRLFNDGYRCMMCGSAKNLNVHHITYDHVYNEPMEDLVTLCNRCHSIIHSDEERAKEYQQFSQHAKYLRDKFTYIAGKLIESGQFDNDNSGLIENWTIDGKIISLMHKGLTEQEIHEALPKIGKQRIRKIIRNVKDWSIAMGIYKNWVEVKPSTGGSSLPEGAYVIVIKNAVDVPNKELVEFTYDIAEGEHAGHCNDDWGISNPWAHQFSRWYSDSSEGSFKTFLETVEKSNPGTFSIAAWQQGGCAPAAFVGLKMGIVLRKRIYIPERGKNAGTVQEALEVGKVISADDVRGGNWEPMQPRDTRTDAQKAQAAQSQQASDLAYAASVVVPFA